MFEFKSAIFIPGSSEKMLSKAATLDADLVLFDLEDAVHESKKDDARTVSYTHLTLPTIYSV